MDNATYWETEYSLYSEEQLLLEKEALATYIDITQNIINDYADQLTEIDPIDCPDSHEGIEVELREQRDRLKDFRVRNKAVNAAIREVRMYR